MCILSNVLDLAATPFAFGFVLPRKPIPKAHVIKKVTESHDKSFIKNYEL